LPFQSVDDIHSGDSLPLSMLGVGDGITDDVLQEHLKDTTGFFIDQTRDTLDSSTTRQTANGRLGNPLDVVTKHLAMTLSATLSKSLASFAASRHVVTLKCDLGAGV